MHSLFQHIRRPVVALLTLAAAQGAATAAFAQNIAAPSEAPSATPAPVDPCERLRLEALRLSQGCVGNVTTAAPYGLDVVRPSLLSDDEIRRITNTRMALPLTAADDALLYAPPPQSGPDEAGDVIIVTARRLPDTSIHDAHIADLERRFGGGGFRADLEEFADTNIGRIVSYGLLREVLADEFMDGV